MALLLRRTTRLMLRRGSTWSRSTEPVPPAFLTSLDNPQTYFDSSELRAVGGLATVGFTDQNPQLTPFQRRYVSSLKRCDDVDRKLRYCKTEIDSFNLPCPSQTTAAEFLSARERPGARGRDKRRARSRPLHLRRRVLAVPGCVGARAQQHLFTTPPPPHTHNDL